MVQTSQRRLDAVLPLTLESLLTSQGSKRFTEIQIHVVATQEQGPGCVVEDTRSSSSARQLRLHAISDMRMIDFQQLMA